MPLTAIDYSHTFIYKLCCKDPSITDIYIGHTTNVVKRRQQHKNCCNNISQKDHNIYVYQVIRNNGGWDNWDMIVLIELNCKDNNEALREERKYLEELKATLNKVIPTRTDKEYYEQHKDKIKEYYAEYNEKNKEKIAEQKKEYREQNKEKIAKYQEQNKEKKKEYNKAHYQKQKALKALSI